MVRIDPSISGFATANVSHTGQSNFAIIGYNTGLFTTGPTTTEPLAQYQPLRTEMEAMWGDAVAPEPDTAAPVIMELATLPDPPRRLIVGSQSFDHVLEMKQAQADLYRSWEHLSRIAPG